MQSASKSSFRPCGLLFFALLLLVGRTDAADGLSLLTNVAQVKRLSSDDANRRYPVQLHGVITYVNPATQMAFLQDKTGGTFFVADHSTGAPKLIRGQSLIITGETARGEFAPFVAGKNNEPVAVTAVQAGQLPEPCALSCGCAP